MLNVQGLGDVTVHSSGEAAFFVAAHGVGGHGDDGNVLASEALVAANGSGGFEAIHFGHLNVHQDRVERLVFESVQYGFARLDRLDGVPSLFEQAHGESAIDRVVFGDQDFQVVASFTERMAGQQSARLAAAGGGLAHYAANRVQQIRGSDRLGEVGFDAQIAAAGGISAKAG